MLQEKSPSCQTQEGFGNKRRVEDPTKINKVKLYTTENFNDCGRNVVEWVQWDEGFLAKIWANGEKKYKVKSNGMSTGDSQLILKKCH